MGWLEIADIFQGVTYFVSFHDYMLHLPLLGLRLTNVGTPAPWSQLLTVKQHQRKTLYLLASQSQFSA